MKRKTILMLSLMAILIVTTPVTLLLGHIIMPMQVDRPGYLVSLQLIQWYEGFENTGETPENDPDAAGIEPGRVVFNIFLTKGYSEPLNNTSVQITLTREDQSLGPWELEQFGEGSYSTTQDIPTAGEWDARVTFESPDESTPVTARFANYPVGEGEGNAGGVIENPSSNSPWALVVGVLAVLAVIGLVSYVLIYGRKHYGKNQKEQAEQTNQ